MSVVALLLGLLGFVAVLQVFRAGEVGARIVATAQDSLGVMADADLSDDEKERRIRRASLRLFKTFFAIAGIGLLALGAAGGIVAGGAALGLYRLDEATATALDWRFLVGSTVAAVALWLVIGKARKPAAPERDTAEEVPYGALDKALHAYAFASLRRQRRLGELESRVFRRRIDFARSARPVFVTSLPRAGTTMLLRTFAALPDFASATYRHMPFTLAPLLWGGFSDAFRKAGHATERAHGDGIKVGFDSPEAFEETLWMAFWPDHYEANRIRPWAASERSAEFEAFFRRHMAKIVATKPEARRYLSKNNANIARLGLLRAACPDAVLVIPVREPRAQVASLLRQHARFSDLHAREPFARQYMEGLGHFEFGGALKPIAFDGFDPDIGAADGADFWLRYWIAAYKTVLIEADAGTVLVDHDALSADPAPYLGVLASAVSLASPDALIAQAGQFRPPPPAPELPGASRTLLRRAGELHRELLDRAIRPAASMKVSA